MFSRMSHPSFFVHYFLSVPIAFCTTLFLFVSCVIGKIIVPWVSWKSHFEQIFFRIDYVKNNYTGELEEVRVPCKNLLEAYQIYRDNMDIWLDD